MTTYTAGQKDIESLRAFLGQAESEQSQPGRGEEVSSKTLSPQILQMLHDIVDELSQGHGVTVLSSEARLTTQEAADLLDVSRPTLIKLLDQYQIPFETVGRHRRIRFEDVQILQAKFRDARRHSRLEMVEASQGAGEYDADPSDNPLIRQAR